jgi:hypothetical protein
MAFFLDPELQALLESERRGVRRAREERPLHRGAAPLEGPVGRRVYGPNKYRKQCAAQDCTRRGYIAVGEGVLTRSPAGDWEVLHASCNGG